MNVGLHISVRVPWQDAGWSGVVCDDPLGNASCVLLKNIGSNRDDAYELRYAGKPFHEIDNARIPCLDERGTFLSPRSYDRVKEHPYRFNPALSGCLRPTTITIPAYAAHAIPYRWLNRSTVEDVARDVDVDYRPELEEFVEATLKYTPAWVMHGDNQKELIDRFWADVEPESSLVFFYAKHSPFDGSGPERNLLVGAARVTGIEPPGPWKTNGRSPFPNHMWETTVKHSLRPDGLDGIFLPVTELAKLDADGMDVSSALVRVPEEFGHEFSYATEHVSSDTAIAVLERMFEAAQRCAELGIDVPGASLDWVSDRIGELWLSRGPAPGLGAVLKALGVRYGPLVARKIVAVTAEGVDPWDVLVEALEGRSPHKDVVEEISTTPRKVWRRLDDIRRRAFKLMSRFQLAYEQVAAVIESEEWSGFLDNPYLACTLLVQPPLHLPFNVIDRGCYPSASIRTRFPLEEPSAMSDDLDSRRVEALLVDVLEEATRQGHTVLPLDHALSVIEQRALKERCPVTEEVLRAHMLHPNDLLYEEDAWAPLVGVTLADGSPAFKLAYRYEQAVFIRRWLETQRAIPRLPVPDRLPELIDQVLGNHRPADESDAEAERRARREKADALAELFASPLTVLNGRAGTGKTTLIRALVRHLTDVGRQVLLLAPTGKARVQLQTKVGHEAKTLAQFLSACGRYDRERGYYCTPERKKAPHYDTVVVDESSMLTEDQLAALLDALPQPRRLIFVGDPRQLPPIGAGRPFVDLITFLIGEEALPAFPKVAAGYAELSVLRRQAGQTRDDLQLAAWFSGDEIPDGFDEVWQRLHTNDLESSLAAILWQNRRPEDVIREALGARLGITGPDEFELSYGGRRNGEWVNFETGSAEDCERWQILSPTRGRGWGTVEINRRLKQRFRERAMRHARLPDAKRWVPKPIGVEQIVIGDKVLNTRNQQRADGFPRHTGLKYVANGEIGLVIGRIGRKGTRPKQTNVEFSSQLGTQYSYEKDDEEDPTLELAWAITIHKSQGSEFGTVFVMLPNSVRRLSREMLYTALTRQQESVVLLHEGTINELFELTSAAGSETARRLTDLFGPPDPRQVRFPDGQTMGVYDARLIHLTASGVLVRSKNEVIVSQILDELAPGSWSYEEPLTINGWTRRPDFTVVAGGRKIYWEHLGMLELPEYRRNWERKKAWYADGGVLPHEQGGGPEGVLMWTDDADGVDVPGWTEHARAVIGTGAALPVAPSRTRKKAIRRTR
ncbi:ATP-dependent DNA helicase [Amycolatopsis tolypomycina]|uniref:ATP-dependent DNA helicase n=1 Tax=Amycolatopsis tolypomycina TaxID=208445 RepID=UPI0033A300C3